jgi:DNA-binding GntR family transcriptional regulator
MSAATPAADALATVLRGRILDGALPGGARLREQALAAEHDVARHTVRAALRALAADGLVRIEPNRGAGVTALSAADIADLHAARSVVERGAVELALARHGGRLPPAVHAAAGALVACCRAEPAPAWREVVAAHGALHEALVAAANSPRLARAHAALAAELALFLVQGRPHFALETLATEHLQLVAGLERDGPRALSAHLEASASTLLGR